MNRKLIRTIRALGSKKIRHLEVVPPREESDRDGLAIVSIVKDAEKYLAEWIAFHLAVGVTHFFIYDNESTDGTQRLLQTPQFARVTTSIPWSLRVKDIETGRVVTQQVSAYAHAVTSFGGRFRRMAFIDVDEFLVPTAEMPLLEAFLSAGDVSNISLPWHMFGHNGHRATPEGLVIENYTSRASTPYSPKSKLLRFKCVVDPCRVSVVGAHSFETVDMGRRTANAGGLVVDHSERRKAGFFTSSPVQLNHYYLRSEHDLAQKTSRAPVGHAEVDEYAARVSAKVAEIEASQVFDARAADVFRRAPPELRELAHHRANADLK